MKTFKLKTLILVSPWLMWGCTGGSGEKAGGERPNILIAMGDDISFPHMGAYGTTWVRTPGFDRVAKNGILFRNAYTPNAKSSPSRACFLTGRYSWQLEAAADHVPYFPTKFKSFFESLGEHGYYTGYTAKGWAPGVAVDSLGQNRNLTGKAFNSKRTTPSAKGFSSNDYAANFEDFLNSGSDGKPFCFWYGSNEAHRPYEYESGARKGGKKTGDIQKIPGFLPDNDVVRNDLLDYALEIEYFDSQLVRMLDLLEKKGKLDNTIVIVTADNGMPFPRAKGQDYEYSNHMPLAIMWGKGIRNPGRQLYDFISFTDFAPTLLEVAGITPEESGMKQMEGSSFTELLYSKKKGFVSRERNHTLLGRERNDVGRPGDAGYPVRGIVMEGFLLIRNFKPERWPSGNPETGYLDTDGSPSKSLILNLKRTGSATAYWKLSFGLREDEELYDLGKDPDCLNNLANDAGYNPLKRRLNEVMYNDLLNQDDPRMYGKGDLFDQYPYADETVRDFYNRFMKGDIPRKKAGWVDSTDFETEQK